LFSRVLRDVLSRVLPKHPSRAAGWRLLFTVLSRRRKFTIFTLDSSSVKHLVTWPMLRFISANYYG
jgi:hypothetical protein